MINQSCTTLFTTAFITAGKAVALKNLLCLGFQSVQANWQILDLWVQITTKTSKIQLHSGLLQHCPEIDLFFNCRGKRLTNQNSTNVGKNYYESMASDKPIRIYCCVILLIEKSSSNRAVAQLVWQVPLLRVKRRRETIHQFLDEKLNFNLL